MCFLCSEAPTITGRIPRGCLERGSRLALGKSHPVEKFVTLAFPSAVHRQCPPRARYLPGEAGWGQNLHESR